MAITANMSALLAMKLATPLKKLVIAVTIDVTTEEMLDATLE